MTTRFDRFVQSILSESHTITIHGEYWFDENGNAMYADGDMGDMNHEAYVIQRCASEVAQYFGLYADEEGTIEPLEEQIVYKIIQAVDADDPNYDQLVNAIQNDPADAMINYMTENGMNADKASDLVLTAYGSFQDAREYAIKNWNWIRVHGANIEVNKLNPNTLSNVATGINNALEEEGLIYDEEEEEAALNGEYRISTYTGKRYVMTLRDMESGNTSGMENDELEVKKSAATQQLRNMDVQSMPSYYQKKGIIGDSVSFKEFARSVL